MKLTRILMVLAVCTLLVAGLSCSSSGVTTYSLTVLWTGEVEQSSVYSDASDYEYGSIATVTALPATGWKLGHWEIYTFSNGEVIDTVTSTMNPLTITMDSDKQASAFFIEEGSTYHPTPTHTTTYHPTPTHTHTPTPTLPTSSLQDEWAAEEYLLAYIHDSATTYHGQQIIAAIFDGNLYHGSYTENSDGSWLACPKLCDWVVDGNTLLEPIFTSHYCDSIGGKQCQWGVDWNCCWATMCFRIDSDGTVHADNGNAIRLMAELQYY